MQFWKGKLWILMALVALCGPISPLVARACDSMIGTEICCQQPSPRAETCLHCAPCCAPPAPSAIFGAVVAPFPSSYSSIVDLQSAPLDFVLPATAPLETSFVLLEGARQTEIPPPRELFGDAFSCRAPPQLS